MGLCLLDPASDLPPEWGFSCGDLPFIGASPDAMLRHDGEACQATDAKVILLLGLGHGKQ